MKMLKIDSKKRNLTAFWLFSRQAKKASYDMYKWKNVVYDILSFDWRYGTWCIRIIFNYTL